MSANQPEGQTFDLDRLQVCAADVRYQVRHVYLLLRAVVRLSECGDEQQLAIDLARQAESMLLITTNDAENLASDLVEINFGAVATKQTENEQ